MTAADSFQEPNNRRRLPIFVRALFGALLFVFSFTFLLTATPDSSASEIKSLPLNVRLEDVSGRNYQTDLTSVSQVFSSEGFRSIASDGKGASALAWSDGIFLTQDLRQVIFVKFHVKVSDPSVENGLYSQSNGYFYHSTTQDHVPYALFFVGFQESDTQRLVRLVKNSVGTSQQALLDQHFKISRASEFFIPVANATDCLPARTQLDPIPPRLEEFFRADPVTLTALSCLIPGWDAMMKEVKEHFVEDFKDKFKENLLATSPAGSVTGLVEAGVSISKGLWGMGKFESKYLFENPKVHNVGDMFGALETQLGMAIHTVRTLSENIETVMKTALGRDSRALHEWELKPAPQKAQFVCESIGHFAGRQSGNMLGFLTGGAAGMASWLVVPIAGEATGATQLIKNLAMHLRELLESKPWAADIVSGLDNYVSRGAKTCENCAVSTKNLFKKSATSSERTIAADTAARTATSGAEITQDILKSKIEAPQHAPPVHEFIKDAPEYGWVIKSDKMEDIPPTIRNSLGLVDQTKYPPGYLKDNIGSVIAVQFGKEGAPDFYIIGKDTFQNDYKTVSIQEVKQENPKLVSKLDASAEASLFKVPADPNKETDFVGILKTTPVQMHKMSDLGFPLDKEVTIDSPWGKQIKPKGQDAFLAKDIKHNQYYMINVDDTGKPIAYVETGYDAVTAKATAAPANLTRKDVRSLAIEFHQVWTEKNAAALAGNPALKPRFVGYEDLSSADQLKELKTLIANVRAQGEVPRALYSYRDYLIGENTLQEMHSSVKKGAEALSGAAETLEIPVEKLVELNEKIATTVEARSAPAGKSIGIPARIYHVYDDTVEASVARFNGPKQYYRTRQTQAFDELEQNGEDYKRSLLKTKHVLSPEAKELIEKIKPDEMNQLESKLPEIAHVNYQSKRTASPTQIDQWLKRMQDPARNLSPQEKDLVASIQTQIKSGSYPKYLPELKPANGIAFAHESPAIDIANSSFSTLSPYWRAQYQKEADGLSKALSKGAMNRLMKKRVLKATGETQEMTEKLNIELLRAIPEDYAHDEELKELSFFKKNDEPVNPAKIREIHQTMVARGDKDQATNFLLAIKAVEVLKANPMAPIEESQKLLAPKVYEAWRDSRARTPEQIKTWLAQQKPERMTPDEKSAFDQIKSRVEAGNYPKYEPKIKPTDANNFGPGTHGAVDVANMEFNTLPTFWQNDNAKASKNLLSKLEELRKENPQLKSKLYDALSGVVNDTSGNSDDKLLRIAKRYQAMDTPKRRLLGDPLANDPVLIAAAHEFAKWKERVGVDYQGPASAIMLIQTLDSADELYDDANEKKESASKLLENSHDENADAEKPKPFRSPASH